MAQLQFLDSRGLKSVLNRIKDTFVPKSRKIANIDLDDDITAEELGNNLKDYVDGKSAYEVAVDNGFEGSERRWLESLKGENAYELAQQDGFSGTEEEWLESLKGKSGVYVGSGDMPEGYNVQIDPEGETFDINNIIDQIYNPESKNAQSGKAVKGAIQKLENESLIIKHRYFSNYTYEILHRVIVTNGESPIFFNNQGSAFEGSISGIDLPNGAFLAFDVPNANGIAFWHLRTNTLYFLQQRTITIDGKQQTSYEVTSSKIITDEGNYYTDKTINGAFQEIGAKFGDINIALDNIIAIQNSYIGEGDGA